MAEIHLRDTEWSLLRALWDLEEASARDISAHLQAEHGWAYSTVKTLLDRMVKRGVVAQRREGRTWMYSAAIARRDAQRTVWQRFVDLAFQGSLAPALQFIARDTSLTDDQRSELLALLHREE